VRGIMEELETWDTRVLGVAAQDREELRKFLQFHELPFTILNDEDRKIVKAYGIEVDLGPPRGVVPNPTDIILDSEGVIRYIYIGDSPDDFPRDEELYGILDSI